MKVVARWDEKGNPIFEVKSKRIFFDLVLLRGLVKRNISIVNLDNGHLFGRAKRDGTVGLNFLKIVGRRKNNHLIKKEMLDTLAHEVRHVLQPESKDGFRRLSMGLLCSGASILCIVLFVLYFFISSRLVS